MNIAAATLLWFLGCTPSDYGLIKIIDPVSAEEIWVNQEEFTQIKTVGVNPYVDVLLIMDNSGSMYNIHDELVAVLPDLISHLDATVPSYRFGVVTTDMVDTNQTGKLLTTANQELWVDSDDSISTQTSELESLLLQITTYGSYIEKGRDAAYTAIGPSYVSTESGQTIATEAENYNSGFRRPEADLDLIIVTDENDSSVDDAAQTDYVASIDEFVTQLQAEAAGYGTRYTLSLISNMSGCNYGADNAQYVELYNAFNTNTIGSMTDVCNPEAAVENLWSALAREPIAYFYLEYYPTLNANFKVKYTPSGTGVEIETNYETRGDYWDYYESTKMIYFNSDANDDGTRDIDYLPQSESKLYVEYEVDHY